MKVNFTTELSSNRYEKNQAERMLKDLMNTRPSSSRMFLNKHSYKEELDMIYFIIQPQIESTILTPKDKKQIENALLIMLENGISLSSNNSIFITNSKGNSRRAIYEPAFEKYMIYDNELPRQIVTDVSLRHIQNNYKYVQHQVECGTNPISLLNLDKGRKVGDDEDDRKDQDGKNGMVKEEYGNVYGSLKRRKTGDSTLFHYEYFEGSTNKIKHPLKYSQLLDMFN